jgi:hypothetical protein
MSSGIGCFYILVLVSLWTEVVCVCVCMYIYIYIYIYIYKTCTETPFSHLHPEEGGRPASVDTVSRLNTSSQLPWQPEVSKRLLL